MSSERAGGEDPKPRYKIVNSDFGELMRKSEHWDRVFPEAANWRREQHRRAEIEAADDEELFRMRVQIATDEWKVFPEAGQRIIGDAMEDIVDSYIGAYRMRYLFLFGLVDYVSLKRANGAIKGIDWEKVFEQKS